MDTFTSIGDAISALVAFDRARFADMPESVQAELTRLAGVGISPVDRIVRTAEILYANQGKLTRKADKELVAALFEFAGLNGWHGLNEGGRAEKIKAVMLSKAGGRAVSDKNIPEPLDEFKGPPSLPAAPAV